MKVLHLDAGKDWRGGQQQVWFLAHALRDHQVSQFFAVRRATLLAERLRRQDFHLEELGFGSEFDPGSLFQLGRIVRRFNPDVIHAHDSRSLGLAALLRLGGTQAKLVASRRVAFGLRRNPLRLMKYQTLTSRILAVSRYIRETLIRDGIADHRIDVVYDGLDLHSVSRIGKQEARRQLGLKGRLIGTVGQFTEEKGHGFLIEAFALLSPRIPNAWLILAGNGRLEARYRRLVHSLKLDEKVVFLDPSVDLNALLQALDVFVLPSIEEGLGSILLLALAHELPVCASQTGGIPEIVIPETTGFLVPPRDADRLGSALVEVLQNDAKAKDVAHRGRQLVEDQFSVERMAAQTLQIYANVLAT
ncbi:MAG: glycosyltransferase family 4 protein [Acidobacteriota bacterium]